MIFQAHFKLASCNIGFTKRQLACTQRDIQTDKVEQLPHFARRCKWTYVFGAVMYLGAGKKNTWKRFFFNNDIRITLIIFQVNIKHWLKLLDKAVLEQKGI